MAYVSLASTAGERLRDQRFFRAGVRPDVAASLLPVVAAPFRQGCRDLLHSAGDPPCLGIKKQRVVEVPTDAWLATSRAVVLEVHSSTCSASHTLLPPASAGPLDSEVPDGLGS